MDPKVLKLMSPEACERFARNAIRLGERALADQALRRAVEIRASSYGASTDAEKECLKAIFAYEEVLSKKNGKRTRATRTWQMIHRHGILASVERVVARPTETAGYTALAEMGLMDFAFEAVILRHPALFSEEAVAQSRKRLKEWGA